MHDNGPGLPPASGRGSRASSGFGLLIVKRALERIEGKLELATSPRLKGALVRITLPRAS